MAFSQYALCKDCQHGYTRRNKRQVRCPECQLEHECKNEKVYNDSKYNRYIPNQISTNEAYKLLASAIIEEGIRARDYKFFRSDWFEDLSELALLDPYVIREKLYKRWGVNLTPIYRKLRR